MRRFVSTAALQRLLVLAAIISAGYAAPAYAGVAGNTYTSYIYSAAGTPPTTAVISFSNTATFTYEPAGEDALGGYYIQTGGATIKSAVVMTFTDESGKIGNGAATTTDLTFGLFKVSLLYGAATINGNNSAFAGYSVSLGLPSGSSRTGK